MLCVCQFTLYGDARRGNRPSFVDAAPPEDAEPLYERVRDRLGAEGGRLRRAHGGGARERRPRDAPDRGLKAVYTRRAGLSDDPRPRAASEGGLRSPPFFRPYADTQPRDRDPPRHRPSRTWRCSPSSRSAAERLRVVIDRESGVDLALCERVTGHLRDLLADYALEVSSPGARAAAHQAGALPPLHRPPRARRTREPRDGPQELHRRAGRAPPTTRSPWRRTTGSCRSRTPRSTAATCWRERR